MKHSKFLVNIIAVVCSCTLTACVSNTSTDNSKSVEKQLAQSDARYNESNQYGFLPAYKADIVNAAEVLPNPPGIDSQAYFYDWYQYYQNKKLRNTERGNAAREDILLTIDFVTRFSDAFGIEISPKNTPAVWTVVQKVGSTLHKANSKVKKFHKRIRPFIQFNDTTGYPGEEADARKSYSYPSSHTTIGFGTALVLAEINPDRQDELFKKGYEYGQSRVILGYHYQSDVEAARLVAAMTVASLHADPVFTQDMERAKAEVKSIKDKKEK